MNSAKWLMSILLTFLVLPSCIFSLDTIAPNQPIKDGDVLVSSRKIFALGFFSPGNSPNRYVGVWYNNIPQKTIVWVANRDNPVTDSSGVLAINIHGDGGLVISGEDPSTPLWSANVTLSSPNDSMAKLLDTGNLVFYDNNGSSQGVLWQSFDHPSNTVLPFMKIGMNRRSGLNWFITSWKSEDDPGSGNSSYGIDTSGIPQLMVHKGQGPWWRGGPWTGLRWSGVPEIASIDIYNVSLVNNQDEISWMYAAYNDSLFTRGVVDESGTFQRLMWLDQENRWIELSSNPSEWCDNYGQCGPNSNCDPYSDYNFACVCLPGFEPKFPRDWYLRVGLGGCVRKAGVSTCRNGEGFVKVAHVKVPDSSAARVNMSLSLEGCEEECLKNCSCMAYTSADERSGGMGCVTWHGDLMDTRAYSNVGQDLYVRVDAIVLAQYAKSNGSVSKRARLGISLGSALVFLLFVSFLCWLARRKRKDYPRERKNEDSSHQDLTFFDLKSVVAATDNFSAANKLGEGGFGSVYKGQLANGQEVAVKRLSKNSGQGLEQFKNEAMLIAKLQHRNLVRLFGYCIHTEEKMLIYECLANKSLDFFIFDKNRSSLLDWEKRFEIIFGIARGVLYLHHDSRLKVVHRDLKASNVLLDSSMNPKISDFGLAKMFGEDQIQAKTNRVIGTYGYMSPEYAMEGRYSTKSDVFSFGVLLLEIISGKRNNSYDNESTSPNLIGQIWDMWTEERALSIVDPSLGQSYSAQEVSRCIQIGLLCVQESATDRPAMSEVVFMLGNETTLPSPKKPAFILQSSNPNSTASRGRPSSLNDMSITMLEARK